MASVFVFSIDSDSGIGYEKPVDYHAGMTILDAARAAGIKIDQNTEFARLNFPAAPGDRLEENDTVEVLSKLIADPKLARRLRAQNAGGIRRASVARHGGRHQLVP